VPIAKVTRRQLLVGVAGATATAGGAGLWLVSRRIRGWRYRNAVDRGTSFAPNAFLAVEPNGDVVIWLVRAEMGQGVETALPMIVAEELDADWSKVRIERAVLDGRYDYGPMTTAASASVVSMWTELRRAGATARHMLIGAAAELWGVPRAELHSERGAVAHTRSQRTASYGELADLAAAQWPPLRPQLKSPRDYRLIGQPVPRRDLAAKITGQAVYGLDVRLPDMLYAAIARCPSFQGSPETVDDAASRSVDGVRDVLRVPAGVAVVATNSYSAMRGRDLLRIAWRPATAPISTEQISAALVAAVSSTDARVARADEGSVAALGGRTVTATYEVPYLAHAPLEPMNCTASVGVDRCEIWAPTQAPHGAVEAAAQITGLPAERITVQTTYLGGGFGRRTSSDFVAEAVDLSMRTGKPIQVLWSREDDMRNGSFRPAVAQRIEAAIDERGFPIAWRHRVASVQGFEPSDIDGLALMGADTLPYDVGPMRVEWNGVYAPIPTTIWRSVGHSFTTFAVESFIDELARSSGQDPVSYRLALLPPDHRLRTCISRVADLSKWFDGDRSRALGIAAAECFGSYIALVVQVAPDSSVTTGIRVSNAWCVVDCGTVVNPDIAAAQIEGGIVFGLTAALKGRITVADGAIREGNFDAYSLLRIDEAPEVEIAFIASGEHPGGVGELGVPPVGPAVANAAFAARNVRVRSLPIAIGV
jgi:isoquinoline 1-oxidoreductase beta subunit